MRELGYEELKIPVELPKDIKDTSSFSELTAFIGQKRAEKSLEKGLNIPIKGYNIFVSGLTDTGRRTFAKKYLKRRAAKAESPCDWVYVYNFDNPRNPNAISLKTGLGKDFKKKLKEFVEYMVDAILEAFQSEDYQKKMSELKNEQNEKKNKLFKELSEKAKEKGYKVQISQTGVATVPVKDGKPLTKDSFDQLSKDEKKEIEERGKKVRELVNSYVLKIKGIEREYANKLKDLNKEVAEFTIKGHIEELKNTFEENEEIQDFIDRLKNDILDNLNVFFKSKTDPKTFFGRRYAVNLFIDNSETEGKPVVEEMNISYSRLFGRIEYVARMGTLDTDHTMIRPGAIQKANGGYIILDALNVLSEPYVWRTLKQLLFSGNLTMENIEHKIGFVSTVSLKPESIPIDVKVVLIGEPWIYSVLSRLDPDFQKLFKVKAEFDWEMDFKSKTTEDICRFVCTTVRENDLLEFNRDAIEEVIRKSINISGSRKKLSTRFGRIKQLIVESSTNARVDDSDMVYSNHVKEAWDDIYERGSLYRDKIEEKFRDAMLYVETEGEKVGEINGLTVIQTEDITFGVPVKLTGKATPGTEGILDIQREAGLSGKIHTKASLIIKGYMSGKYAHKFPLSLNGYLSFEQVYGMVDGDSASVAETVALLSAVSDIPVKQNIAVTGSINQSGRVQPVGGVSEKIEGFYRLCRMKGCNDEQGVIVPESNFENIVLPDEIYDSIDKGEFHIWTVEMVDEAIELLTGKKAGKRDSRGKYEEGSFNEAVVNGLEKLYKVVKESKKDKK
ncbi:MAG: Lon protease family protein [Petrotogales bacterium]